MGIKTAFHSVQGGGLPLSGNILWEFCIDVIRIKALNRFLVLSSVPFIRNPACVSVLFLFHDSSRVRRDLKAHLLSLCEIPTLSLSFGGILVFQLHKQKIFYRGLALRVGEAETNINEVQFRRNQTRQRPHTSPVPPGRVSFLPGGSSHKLTSYPY